MFQGRWFRASLLVTGIVAMLFATMHRWFGDDGNGWEALIDGDSKGYYAYLPAVFVYHDLSFSFFDAHKKTQIARYYNPRLRVHTPQGDVNKNYAGVALMLTPFFLAGHLAAIVLGYDPSGYSQPYFFFTLMGALAYFLAGLYFMGRLLHSYGIGDGAIAFCIVAAGVATNLLYYTSVHAAMAHVYSFAAIAAFSWLVRLFFIRGDVRFLLMAALAAGLIILIRPVNAAVFAALPILAGSVHSWKRGFRMAAMKPALVLISAVVLIAIPAIQCLLYYMQTGHFWVWSYGNEGFVFAHPKIARVLFSFRKGLFIYTPVLLLMIPGWVVMLRKNAFAAIAFAIFGFLIVYLVASWWNWYFGDGYGSRSFIDFYSLLFIPVGYLADGVCTRFPRLLIATLLVFVAFSLIQTYQYRYRIIHPSAMNREKYKFVFLQTGSEYRDILGGDMQAVYGHVAPVPLISLAALSDAETNPDPTKVAGSGISGFSQMDSSREFGPGIEFKPGQIVPGKFPLYARISLQRNEPETGACNGALLVCSISDSSDTEYSYEAYPLADFPRKETGIWRTSMFGFFLPDRFRLSDHLVLYIWNKQRKRFRIREFHASIHKVEPLK